MYCKFMFFICNIFSKAEEAVDLLKGIYLHMDITAIFNPTIDPMERFSMVAVFGLCLLSFIFNMAGIEISHQKSNSPRTMSNPL